MSLKNRVIDGLNFIYDSGPQPLYENGTKISRWTLVVDELLIKKFYSKKIPLSSLAEADGISVRLPDNFQFEKISWEKEASLRINRIFSRDSTTSLELLGINQFENLFKVEATGKSLIGLNFEKYEYLEYLSVFKMEKHVQLINCRRLNEILIWMTDFSKIDYQWIDENKNIKFFEFIQCSNFNKLNLKLMPSVVSLNVVKPSKDFALSKIIKVFPSLDSIVLMGVEKKQVDCELNIGLELFHVNGKIII